MNSSYSMETGGDLVTTRRNNDTKTMGGTIGDGQKGGFITDYYPDIFHGSANAAIADATTYIAKKIPELIKEIRTLSSILRERDADIGNSSDVACKTGDDSGDVTAPEKTMPARGIFEKVIHMDVESLFELNKEQFLKKIALMALGDEIEPWCMSYKVIGVRDENVLDIKVKAYRGYFTERHVVTVIESKAGYMLLKDAEGDIYKITGRPISGKGETLVLKINKMSYSHKYWLVNSFELTRYTEGNSMD